MALGDVIARLSVSLGMETASFDKGAKSAETTLGRLKNFLLGPGGIAVAAIGAAAGLAKLGIEGLKTADEISKAAQSIGIGTEELSKLRYAAELSDVSFESLTKAVGRLSRNMADAADGVKMPAKAFELLHIAVTNSDGTLRSSSDVIGDVADRFAKMDDGARKTALAMQIFGRSGAEMIPMLNEGREGIKKLTDEASKFGIVIDEETGKRAEAFNDNITRLKGAVNALATEFAADLLPYLVGFTNWLVANAGTLRQYAATFGATFRNIVSWVGLAINKLADWAEALNKVQAVMGVVGMVLRRDTNMYFNPIDTKGLRFAASSIATLAKGAANIPAVAKPATLAITALGNAGEGAGKRGAKGIRGMSTAMRDAQRDATQFQQLLDRLFPERARSRQFASDMAALDVAFKSGKLSADEYHDAQGRLLAELGKIEQEISKIAPLDKIEADPIADLTFKLPSLSEALDKAAGRTKDSTTRIAKSFKDMATDTMNSLQSLTNAIKGGGFLNILQSAVNFALQLGSIGAFGKTIATRLNATVPGRATGGPISAGMPYLVGEHGPELVVPSNSGTVVPNNALGSQGGNSYYFRGNLMTPEFWAQIHAGDFAAANAGANGGVAKMRYANTRRVA